jgi:hypothetical protein
MNDAIGNQFAGDRLGLPRQPARDVRRLRAIAVTGHARSQAARCGDDRQPRRAGFAAYTWWGVFGPANMPPALAKRVADELARPRKAPP